MKTTSHFDFKRNQMVLSQIWVKYNFQYKLSRTGWLGLLILFTKFIQKTQQISMFSEVFFLSIYSSHNNSKYTYVKQCNFNKINVFLNKICDILKLHYQPYERTRIVCVCCIHLWLLVVNYNVHGKLTPFALYMTSLGFTFGTQICFEWDINT